ncbi:hypothetical protein ACKUSY_12795 [Myroides odoratus]
MELIYSPRGEIYVRIRANSDLTFVDQKYKNGNYTIQISDTLSSEQLQLFVQEFKEVRNLNLINTQKGELDFLYQLKNLKTLNIHFYSDIKAFVDFKRIALLDSLSMNWYPKYFKNIEYQSNSLKHLNISDLLDADLTMLESLAHLETFRTVGGKLRCLNGIERWSKLKKLEISAHRSLSNIDSLSNLQKLKYLEINTCWKLQDFSPIGQLSELEVLKIIDCKNLVSIQFVRQMPKLRQLYTLGTTVINDYDTTPAEHVPIFFGSFDKRYNKMYPEKEIREGQRGWSSYS